MPEPSRRAPRRSSVALKLATLLLLASAPLLGQDEARFSDRQALAWAHCVPDEHTLCLGGARFAVTAAFQLTPSGPSAPATAVPLTQDSGYFWFFDASNVELIVKVLDGCSTNGFHWVFESGLTNVGVGLEVRDMETGQTKTYQSEAGTPFVPIQDTNAFQTCP